MLFLERLRCNCLEYGSRTAIEFRGDGLTERVAYDELWRLIDSTAAWLARQGVHQGDRVAVCLPKCLSAILLHLAACRLGAISMPLNPAYSVAELRYFLKDSTAKLLVIDKHAAAETPTGVPSRVIAIDSGDFHRSLPPAATGDETTQPSDKFPALMLYTSGTTGLPKGALMSHGSLTANLDMLCQAWRWSAADVLLHVLPLFHVHGLLVALQCALHAGAVAIVRPSFDADIVLRDLQQANCSVFMAVPTMYHRLLAALGDGKLDLRHMRLLTSGSDCLPIETFAAIKTRLGHCVVERYGMTETGIMLSNPVNGARIAGQVGLPLPGVRMRTVDEASGTPCAPGQVGELQTKGPHVFLGYWNDPDKTGRAFTKDGWFRTGDLGLRNARGRFELKGRMTDLIITGGLNVYPTEVEHVLARHAGVAQCAVAGVPDAAWGEAVTAFVVRADRSTSATELIRHCRTSLAAYKSPKRVVFVHGLPRSAMGKVQRKKLVASLSGTAPEQR